MATMPPAGLVAMFVLLTCTDAEVRTAQLRLPHITGSSPAHGCVEGCNSEGRRRSRRRK